MLGGDIVRTRLGALSIFVAAAACLLGIDITTPIAIADSLPNGYSVTCTPNGADDVICNISGCPRVHADEAGDVVHTRFNDLPQTELSKGCNNTTTENLQGIPGQAFTYHVQGCRKHSPGSDDCGGWSDYHYSPPAQAAPPPAGPLPVHCTGGPDAGKTLPPGSTCAAAVAAPTKCPAGSVTDTVPADKQCAGPSRAVDVSIGRRGLNANVAITNLSSLPAKCTYTAIKAKGLGPQEVDRSVDVGPHGTGTITDMLWPPSGTTYNVTVKCTATYDGKPITIGNPTLPVNG
jgi:hypothetical protein